VTDLSTSDWRDRVVGRPLTAESVADLGNALLATGKFAEALSHYDRALELEPGFFPAHLNRAQALRGLGQRDAALASYDRAMTHAPQIAELHAQIRLRQAALLVQLGRGVEAVAMADAALAIGADIPEAWTIRGSAQASLRHFEEALGSFDRALALRPTDESARIKRGMTLQGLGRLGDALSQYEAVLVARPDCYQALINQAAVLLALRRYPDALLACEAVLALAPDLAEAHFNHGCALLGLARVPEACASFARAGSIKPDWTEAHLNHAAASAQLMRWSAALASYDRAIELQPARLRDDVDTLCNRAAILNELGRHSEALASVEQALALDPSHADAYACRADALRNLGRYEEALHCCEQALALNPEHGVAHANRGTLLTALGRVGEALKIFTRAVEKQPGDAEARLTLAHTLLLNGDFERGWLEHEWRWRSAQLSGHRRHDLRGPLWLGKESLAGKTILLHAEQGLGDTLQFCRYATLAAESGARVILQVPATLTRLMRTVDGVERVLAVGEELPEIDFHCPMMSLPLAFKTTLATVPGRVPYFQAAAQDRDYWAQRLAQSRRPRIGVVWSGGFRVDQPRLWTINERRNVALARLAVLRNVDADFFGLQKGEPGESELSELKRKGWDGPWLRDYTSELRDFADTAALIEQLDLVISVDTSTAHLAAGLGKVVWLLNRHDTCWRWLLDRSDSPWYPTLKLYRQSRPGDWDGTIRRLHDDLEVWVRRQREAG
jgi:tetratricopeptide (TPR) repeat protein